MAAKKPTKSSKTKAAAKKPAKSKAKKSPAKKKPAARRKSKGKSFLQAFGGILALGGTLGILWLGLFYVAVVVEVRDKMSGQRWELPTKLYAKPMALQTGTKIPSGNLGKNLESMGYQKRSRVQRAGEFRHAGNGQWYIFPYDAPGAQSSATKPRLSVKLSGDRITAISNYESKRKLRQVSIPSLPFAEIHQGAKEARRVYKLKEFSPYLPKAIVNIEDERFYSHGALDPIGIARAIFVNITQGRLVQGGSTLTQQVAKNFFLTHERTFSRKLKEVLYSVALERNYTKDEILEVYLNEIYLGQSGAVAIHGMGEAAYHYLSRKPSELRVADAALLAGIIQSPNGLNPNRHPERAIKRRNVVLHKMKELGTITDAQYKAAKAQGLNLRPGKHTLRDAPYFVDQVIADLEAIAPAAGLAGAGLEIQTTLDWSIQRAAESALSQGLNKLGKKGLQGAMVVLDPENGDILALVGGRDYGASQFNRAINAYRQPGSAFKPLVYASALQTMGTQFSPATRLDDEPLSIQIKEGEVWTPRNFDNKFRGEVTARTTIEQSLNIPTVRLAQDIGIARVVQTARQAGIQSACAPAKNKGDAPDCTRSNPQWQHPSLALGSKEVSPLELATAYTAIAGNGRVHPAHSVLKVTGPDKEQITGFKRYSSHSLLTSSQAWMLRHMLEGVVDRGTAKNVRSMGYRYAASGKTGTTNGERDAWFVGFDPELLTVIWVGYDDNRSSGFSGGRAAVPVWTQFMKEVRGPIAPPDDPVPSQIEMRKLCETSHGIAGPRCPDTYTEAYWNDRENAEYCREHGNIQINVQINDTRVRVRSWLERVFGNL